MAGMKRFVTYIYAYEEKRKGGNVGFAKIEIRGDECRIEIHLRGVYMSRTSCKIYLFHEDAGDMEGILIGEMRIMNGTGDFGTIIKAGQIGDSPFGIADMEGVFLISEEERLFMSRWKEGIALEVSRERFKTWEPPQLREERKAATEPQQPVPQTKPQVQPETQRQPDTLQPTPHEDISATEIPMRNVFPRYSWEEVWENLQENHPVFAPFPDTSILCIRIELKDLRELPKRYWYLGNNSFLLHGFFNYRYLVIGKLEEDRWFLGVPGIYQNQERVMATIFGFPEFIAEALHTEDYAGMDEKEVEPVNRFGYWYHLME